MATFFTSDLHLGHENIIHHSRRPFANADEMDKAIIENWNEIVQPDDNVWMLGDFTMYGEQKAAEYLDQLNGHIHLVWGNHDRPGVRQLKRWQSSQYAAEIKLDGDYIVLCHYPMISWNGSLRGSLMLYGHEHGRLIGSQQSIDVGVDVWNYRPVTLEQIKERIKNLPPIP